MNEKKSNRSKRIYIRVTESEYNKLLEGFKKSTLRKFSEYNRDILLNQPITLFTRNKSYDEMVEEMVALKAELNAIGVNFNQAVKKLHTMTHDEEIKGWARLNEKDREVLSQKVDAIEDKMSQIANRWSQE